MDQICFCKGGLCDFKLNLFSGNLIPGYNTINLLRHIHDLKVGL